MSWVFFVGALFVGIGFMLGYAMGRREAARVWRERFKNAHREAEEEMRDYQRKLEETLTWRARGRMTIHRAGKA